LIGVAQDHRMRGAVWPPPPTVEFSHALCLNDGIRRRPGESVMSEEPVLYYNPISRARIVHWMLEEVGAPYRLELVRFDRGEHKTPEYLAINPMGSSRR